jgi:hypothetical protein
MGIFKILKMNSDYVVKFDLSDGDLEFSVRQEAVF